MRSPLRTQVCRSCAHDQRSRLLEPLLPGLDRGRRGCRNHHRRWALPQREAVRLQGIRANAIQHDRSTPASLRETLRCARCARDKSLRDPMATLDQSGVERARLPGWSRHRAHSRRPRCSSCRAASATAILILVPLFAAACLSAEHQRDGYKALLDDRYATSLPSAPPVSAFGH